MKISELTTISSSSATTSDKVLINYTQNNAAHTATIRVADIGSLIIPQDVKDALINIITAGSYSSDVSTDKSVISAWANSSSSVVTLSSITATYNQSGTVYTSASLNDLKSDLIVTAVYSDNSTSTISASSYTLSGTLTEGTSTVTVTYQGKTTTFNVIVTMVSGSYYTVAYNLAYASSSNTATSVEANNSYTTDITANSGYEINAVSIFMGGVDVTNSVYNNGTINIGSVTGNISIIVSTATTISTIVSNYSPAGATFSHSVTVDFANGEYIEAKINLSNCIGTNENILSIGTTINTYNMSNTGLANQGVYHLYYTKGSRYIRTHSTYATTAGSGENIQAEDIFNITGTVIITLSAEGLSFNGKKVIFPTTSTERTALTHIMNAASILVGSMEGVTRSKATYNYIKVKKSYNTIFAIYNPNNTVYIEDSIDTLKDDLTVKYIDNVGNVSVISDSNYNIEGSIVDGIAPIKIAYGFFNTDIMVFGDNSNLLWSSTAAYSNSNLTFDGTSYVDTGFALFNTDKSWKIVINFTPGSTNANTNIALLHCMQESGEYPGAVLDISSSRYRVASKSAMIYPGIGYDYTGTSTVTIIYNADTHRITVQRNSDPIHAMDVTYTQIANTLLIGAYIDTNGNYGRYWTGTVNSINIYYEE